MRKIFGFLAVMMLASTAFASVAVHDNAGIIPQSQENALLSEGSRWPFDLHVLTGAFGSPQALDAAVHRCVTSPNVVCIGVDPVHHKTNVHVGTGVGIPSSEFHSIASAGNSFFKTGDYQGGIEAIATRARESAHTIVNVAPVRNVTPYVAQPQVQVHIDNPVPTGMSTGWWLFAFFMVALIALGTWLVYRAIKTAKKVNEDMNDFRSEAFEMSSRNINAAEEKEFHEKLKSKLGVKQPMVPVEQPKIVGNVVQPVDTRVLAGTSQPPFPGPSKTTVVHNHYGNSGYGPSYNPTLTGSVMTDVLLANELSRPAQVVVPSAPVVVEREVVRDTTPVDSGGSSSNWGSSYTRMNDDNDAGGSSSNDDDNDSGGSSSSWGSNDDSSSSYDSGGSDSGDSGSGGDSGGGDSGW